MHAQGLSLLTCKMGDEDGCGTRQGVNGAVQPLVCGKWNGGPDTLDLG